MLTKGNDTKVQNEVIAQTITNETAKRLKLAKLFPKQEIQITILISDRISILMKLLTKVYLVRLKI